jgi:dUTP pyrophosphatase
MYRGINLMKVKMFNTVFKGENLSRANDTDAGADIRAAVDINIKPYQSVLVSTGLHIEIPVGWAGIIKSRSGLASKHDIEVGAGILDSAYRGECKVLLRSLPFQINKGDKIAQLLIVPVMLAEFVEVDSLDDLSISDRGNKGFGSSGI